MDLTHRFTVPTSVSATWTHFQDIASVAECFPGASVTEADGDSFAGSVKVKLGPIALVYKGSGTFVEKDESAHTFKVDAKGKDKRGNGTAGAKVTLTMSEADGGATDVEVITDLAITGKPAQFGRGVMQDVSDKLLGQFVTCLEQRLAAPGAADAAQDDDVAPAVGEAPVDEPTPIADAAASSASSASSGSSAAAAPPGSTPVTSTPAGSAPRPAPAQDDALDLGSAVLPVLLKSYWKPALGVGVVALAVVWWARRD